MGPQGASIGTIVASDTLVGELIDPQKQDAWRRIEERYGPLVELFACHLGLDAELARDARQEAMLAFVQAIRAGRFDRTRGRLRDFLFAIAKHKIKDVRRGQDFPARLLEVVDDGGSLAAFLSEMADPLRKQWEEEWQTAVYGQCLKVAREHFSADTYLMFYLHVIEALPSAEVAQRVGRSAGAVDMAAHHVREYLRGIRPAIEERF